MTANFHHISSTQTSPSKTNEQDIQSNPQKKPYLTSQCSGSSERYVLCMCEYVLSSSERYVLCMCEYVLSSSERYVLCMCEYVLSSSSHNLSFGFRTFLISATRSSVITWCTIQQSPIHSVSERVEFNARRDTFLQAVFTANHLANHWQN